LLFRKGDILKRAVAYIRVSTSKQAEKGVSIETQRKLLTSYIKNNNWKYIREYVDAGLSGANINRDSFQKMMQDAENNEFEYIVVYSLDRFSRSVLDFHNSIVHLDKYGVNIVSVTQLIDTSTPVGRLIRNVLMDFANFEREMIVQRTMDNMLDLAQKGRWLGGPSPYGYCVKDKKLYVKEDEARMVVVLYKEYLAGETIGSLAKKYNMRETKVAYILNNPVYAGKVRFGRNSRRKEMTKGKTMVRTPSDKWVIADGTHEAIISYKDWKRVQEIKEKRYGITRERKYKQIFCGVCFCGVCGYRLYFRHHQSKKKIKGKKYYYYYYRCINETGDVRKKCASVSVSEKYIETLFISKINEIMNNNDFWDHVKTGGKESGVENYNTELKRLETKFTKTKTKIRKAVNLLIDSEVENIKHHIKSEIASLEAEQVKINNSITDIKSKLYDMSSLDETRGIIKDLGVNWRYMTRIEKRKFVSLVVDRIDVWKDSIKITFADERMPPVTARPLI